MSTSTHTMSPDMIKGIALVGRVVTYGNSQYKIHSVEGTDWYAFDDQGRTTVDCGFPVANWIKTPIVGMIPSGHKIGDGFMIEIPMDSPFLRPGVCLAKAWVDGSLP